MQSSVAQLAVVCPDSKCFPFGKRVLGGRRKCIITTASWARRTSSHKLASSNSNRSTPRSSETVLLPLLTLSCCEVEVVRFAVLLFNIGGAFFAVFAQARSVPTRRVPVGWSDNILEIAGELTAPQLFLCHGVGRRGPEETCFESSRRAKPAKLLVNGSFRKPGSFEKRRNV